MTARTQCSLRLFALWLLPLAALTIAAPTASADTSNGTLIVRGGGGQAGFDRLTGRIVFLRPDGNAHSPDIARTPTEGDLWTLHLRSGKDIRAADFLKDRPLKVVRTSPNRLRLVYTSAQGATVAVGVSGSTAGVDLHLWVQGLPDDVLDAALPADLAFDPNQIQRVLFPEHLGIALKPAFFQAKPPVFLEEHYPSRAFCDFTRIETTGGAVSIYGVQDAHDPAYVFVPALWRVTGMADGGHLLRRWQTFLPKAVGGETPAVRLRWGDGDAASSLRRYAQENGLDRPLADKMSSRTLGLWKRSLLLKVDRPTAGEDAALIERLPTPAVIHLTGYLHGGFDRQYPDHLPPPASYGTAEEFRQVLALAHRKGDLVMPYTNTTWWPDNPKGPTFEREGEAPLLVRLDGQHNHEVYGPNSSGWSVSPYHRAVLASVDRLVAQFTGPFPVDILFQDQNGARGLMYDLNPASPTPYAYTQGMIALAALAGARRPVATEDGFDHLLNVESEFCGLTQEIGPFSSDQDQLLSRRFPDTAWEFFPMAQYVAHDKAFFSNHDLGDEVANRDALLWSLALGYQLGEWARPWTLDHPQQFQWLLTIERLQKTLGPYYMGAPLRSFRYLRGSGSRGVLEAVYGALRIVSNLTDGPYPEGSEEIAPHGFLARAGHLEAGILVGPDGQGETSILIRMK